MPWFKDIRRFWKFEQNNFKHSCQLTLFLPSLSNLHHVNVCLKIWKRLHTDNRNRLVLLAIMKMIHVKKFKFGKKVNQSFTFPNWIVLSDDLTIIDGDDFI